MLILVSCKGNISQSNEQSDEIEIAFSKQYARYVDDAGWVYSVVYTSLKDGTVDESVQPIVFNVINLRHRYPAVYDESYTAKMQILGDGVSGDTDNDMEKIAAYLGYGSNSSYKPVKEILSQDRDSLALQQIDKTLFFALLDNVFSATTPKVGRYINHPSYGLLNEQVFIDGYSFQVGFMLGMGNVDVVMIDVLYQNDESSWGYIQLSDLVEKGEASEDQMNLYRYLKALETGIVENNDFMCYLPENSDLNSSTIDLSRLRTFLSDIDKNHIVSYLP